MLYVHIYDSGSVCAIKCESSDAYTYPLPVWVFVPYSLAIGSGQNASSGRLGGILPHGE